MKAIVLAGGFDQIELIKELKSRGIMVVLVDYLCDPPAKAVADKHYQISALDAVGVKEIAVKEKVGLITTACTDQALLIMAQVSEELGLPCYLTYETAKNVTNKSYMKKIFADNGISSPKYKIVNSEDIDSFSQFEFPLVVKPVDCNSSKGVNKVLSQSELAVALKEALELSRNNEAVVEEFKDGKEISVDVYVQNGIAKVMLLTESTKIKNRSGFTILQSIYPINISSCVIRKINSIAQNISDAFKIDNSPMLIQLITDGKEINVLEFSARIGGGTKYKLIEKLTGVNIMEIYTERILGNIVNFKCKQEINYAHLNYCYCNPGTFSRLENFEHLKQTGIIEDYFQYKTAGAKVEKADTSSDRVAGYLVVSDTLDNLMEKEKLANRELKIISEDGRDILIHDYIM